MSKKIIEQSKLPKAIYGSDKTPLRIGQVEIPCYVLDDGIRVFSRNGIQKAIGYAGKSGDMLTKFVTVKNGFSPEICAALFNSIQFERLGSGGSTPITYGHEVTLLIDLCNEIIELNRAGMLKPQHQIYEPFAHIIIRATSKVGIIALVDEVTGYQNERVKNALEIILNKFILEEAKKYEVTFPLQLYKEWFRLNDWDWKPENAQKRPGVIGTWTNGLIYKRMAPGLLEELQRKNPKNAKGYREHKHFEFLTDEVGEPRLREFFGGLIALARATTTWRKYMELVNRAYPPPLEGLFKDYRDPDTDK